jgi:predicted TIM-barrel fold metal-dependent hydrolase
MSTPFWDLDFAIAELERCVESGHKAVNFCNHPESHGEPPLSDPHWDRLWAAAQDAEMPITFHIGGGDITAPFAKDPHLSFQAKFPKVSSLMIMDNVETLADLVFGGVCHRFPKLRFVSVESGVGWLPGVLEIFDWQWGNSGIRQTHPEYDLLPSEYFRRQIYGCFWFEQEAARFAIERFPDNVLFETDFPHPTCQHPGPASIGTSPGEYATKALDGVAEDIVARVLHDNAAQLYGLA